uniref:Uncharacterized protein n=1 Tax=Leersia perrieri TaxID=77586 RepID=A0A0D9X706_9ORYZ
MHIQNSRFESGIPLSFVTSIGRFRTCIDGGPAGRREIDLARASPAQSRAEHLDRFWVRGASGWRGSIEGARRRGRAALVRAWSAARFAGCSLRKLPKGTAISFTVSDYLYVISRGV